MFILGLPLALYNTERAMVKQINLSNMSFQIPTFEVYETLHKKPVFYLKTCSKTHLRQSGISKFFRGRTPCHE